MLLNIEGFPLGQHLGVQLQSGACFGADNAHLFAAVHDLVDHDGIHALALQVGPNGDEQQIKGVVLHKSVQQPCPAKGEDASAGFLQRLGNRRCRHTQRHQVLVLIHDKAGQIRVDERCKLGGIAADLLVGQLHRAVQRGVGHIDQLKKLLQNGNVGKTGSGIENVQVIALEHIVCQFIPFRVNGGIGRDGDQIFDPVHILHIAQTGQMRQIVGMVVVGEEAALTVKALHQHTLPVQIGKAQRSVHLVAAQLLCPGFHGGKQRVGHLRVVNKIHLRKAQTAGSPLLVGFSAQNGADTAHDLLAAHGQPAASVAVGKGGIFLSVPVAHIVVISGRYKLGHILI